jgi:hypothetical protein
MPNKKTDTGQSNKPGNRETCQTTEDRGQKENMEGKPEKVKAKIEKSRPREHGSHDKTRPETYYSSNESWPRRSDGRSRRNGSHSEGPLLKMEPVNDSFRQN